MNSSQFWDGFRHFLTALGGAAVLVPNPYVQAAGVLLGVASASTSVVLKGQDTAPAPSLTPIAIPVPSASALSGAVKTATSPAVGQIATIFAFCFSMWTLAGLSACNSTTSGASAPPANQAAIAAAVTTPVTSLLVEPILKKNPTLLPLFQALSDGIETTFVSGVVTNEEIASLVGALEVRYPSLSATDEAEIVVAFQNLLPVYYAFSGKTTFDLTDPTAKQLLESFRAGIDQGIALYQATLPAAAAAH